MKLKKRTALGHAPKRKAVFQVYCVLKEKGKAERLDAKNRNNWINSKNPLEKQVAIQKTGLRFLSMSTNEELNSKSRY